MDHKIISRTVPYKWKKKGLIFSPDGNLWWARTHAMIPTPHQIDSDNYRIYFSGRDDKNRSHIGYIVVNMNNPEKILEVSKEPVLAPGRLGCFDDNGVTPSCLLSFNNQLYLYYIGWNPGSTVRMHLFGGLAISKDNGKTFERYSEAPIIERSLTDPFLNTAPWVVKETDGLRMYYVSGSEWIHKDLPRYNIKTAFSDDGKNWQRDGTVCIDFLSKHENALARPYVYKEGDRWKMWFAHKAKTYELGYAESLDGIHWQRQDSLTGIKPGLSDVDDEMIEYASVISHKGKKYMFYNGNNYGYNGIALAVEE